MGRVPARWLIFNKKIVIINYKIKEGADIDMARGAEAKAIITKKILETFEGSFPYDKEIRVPIVENGETIQVKITLTAAKVNVENGGDNAVPTAVGSTPVSNQNLMITEQEKQETKELLESLNL